MVIISLGIVALVVIISLGFAALFAWLLLRALMAAVGSVVQAQTQAIEAGAQAMSTAARSITAPYSIDPVAGTPFTPSAGAAWVQQDLPDADDYADPTDITLPDPPMFRPDARMTGSSGHWTGVDGLTMGEES